MGEISLFSPPSSKLLHFNAPPSEKNLVRIKLCRKITLRRLLNDFFDKFWPFTVIRKLFFLCSPLWKFPHRQKKNFYLKSYSEWGTKWLTSDFWCLSSEFLTSDSTPGLEFQHPAPKNARKNCFYAKSCLEWRKSWFLKARTWSEDNFLSFQPLSRKYWPSFGPETPKIASKSFF